MGPARQRECLGPERKHAAGDSRVGIGMTLAPPDVGAKAEVGRATELARA